MKKLTRRQFLGQASCAAVGSTAMLSSLLNLRFVGDLAAQNSDIIDAGDYKALVCLFLAGGNDSFNMLVPYDTSSYEEYQKIRGDLALARETLLPIQSTLPSGKSLSLHTGFPEVQNLFNDSKIAFIANVGTLIEPTDLSAIENGNANLPLGLYSHADQIAHWQTAMPDQRTAIGWQGRMADLIQSSLGQEDVSMNISLSGNNILQTGNDIVSFSLDPDLEETPGINGYGNTEDEFTRLKTNTIDNLMLAQYSNLLQQTYADAVMDSIEANQKVAKALESSPQINTQFSNTEVSQSFRAIAHMIAVREQLGAKRQTFFVQVGGWDHHDEVLNNQAQMLPLVSKALSEFNSALEEIGMNQAVTTFTASDFGRTLTSNGGGSDHAWGGNQLVMGGAVNGGMIYGDYPALYEGNPLDTGRGRLIPTLSIDEYYAELALWFGIPPSQLADILPGLFRFYIPNNTSWPVGFMSQI